MKEKPCAFDPRGQMRMAFPNETDTHLNFDSFSLFSLTTSISLS